MTSGDEPILEKSEDRLYSIFQFALKVFLFLSPIYYFGDLKGSFAQSLFFVFGSFILFSFSLVLEPKRKFSNKWLSLFLLWSLLAIFTHGIEIDKISHLAWPVFALSSDGFLYILAGFLLFQTIFCHIKDLPNLLKPILLICIINLVLAILQAKGIDLAYSYRGSICGRMGLAAQLGTYSAMTLPVLLSINPLLTVIPLTSLMLAKSFTSICAAFLGMMAYFRLRRSEYSNIIILLSSITFFIYIWYFRSIVWARFSSRFITWQVLVQSIFRRPFIGWGWYSYLETMSRFEKPVLERPHQDFGHLSQEIGLIGVFFLIFYLKDLWQRFKKADKDKLTWLLATSVFIILINASFQTTLRYANISGTFIFILALLEVKLYETERKN